MATVGPERKLPIEKEIPAHGNPNRQSTGGKQRQEDKQSREHDQIKAKTGSSDQAKFDRTTQMLKPVIIEPDEVNQVVELLTEAQLAFPEPAVPKLNWNFLDLLTTAFDHKFQPDFVANGVQYIRLQKCIASDCKKTRHRISGGGQRTGQKGRNLRVQTAESAPVLVRAPSRDVTAGNNEICVFVFQYRYQFGNLLRRMRQIGVHDNQHIELSATHPVHNRTGQAALTFANKKP